MYFTRLIVVFFSVLFATLTLATPSPPSAPMRVTMAQLIPLTGSQKEFKIIEGKDQGRLVPLTFQSDPSDERKWQLRFGDYGRIFLRSSSGALIMDRLELFKSNSYIVYEPALRVLPSEIESAGVVRRTGYKMFSIESGKLKRAGPVTHSVKRITRSQFTTPAGLLDGYQIEIEHQMDMEYYSQLFLTVSLGCSLDDGLIYGSAQYRLKKLGGLLTETKTSTAALFRRN